MDSQLDVLIVDDEKDFATGLSRLVKAEFPRFKLTTANSGEEALVLLGHHHFQLVLTDLQMPGMDGITLLEQVLRQFPGTKVIILTGYGTIEKAVASVRAGAFDFLTKPVSSDLLYQTLIKVVNYMELQAENDQLRKLLAREKGTTMLGESPAIQAVQESIRAVAASDYPVLICGESGTGKELAARMIHRMSNRADKPFVPVNCPAIPDTLLESELFGYRKGAFTGAEKDRDGLLLSAQHGTLHLDEIGDVSHAMQTKLLRFLQEGEIRPVGSTETLSSDVRIIASTNQPLEQKVAENRFRADLFYRLNVVTIRMPLLRERAEDIALLARYFLEQTLLEMNQRGIRFEPDILSYLTTRDWPGNVRELQNYVRRLVIFSGGEDITMATVKRIEHPGTPQFEADGKTGPYKMMKAAVTDRFSRNYLEQLLHETAGNVSEAARISGLSRVAIQKLCARLNIDLRSYR
jgi:DNA-binding NtrC family response regulator